MSGAQAPWLAKVQDPAAPRRLAAPEGAYRPARSAKLNVAKMSFARMDAAPGPDLGNSRAERLGLHGPSFDTGLRPDRGTPNAGRAGDLAGTARPFPSVRICWVRAC